MKKFKDTDIQLLIGRVLRVGMFISIGVVFLGGIMYIYRHGHSVADYKAFKIIPSSLLNPASLVCNVINLKGQAIIQLGIILLIATPIFRVAFSVIGFIMEKDYMYTFISILVLCIIFISMLTGLAV